MTTLTINDALTPDSVPDTLTGHSAHANNSSDSLTSDSVPDTLTTHSEPAVVGLDWERDGWRVSVNGDKATKVTRDALLTFDFADADVVIVEQAHMRERNVYSVAQVYTEAELRQLPFRSKIRLFPGMPGQLARAARVVGNVSDRLNEYGQPMPDKTRDAETLALFAKQSPARVASWKPLYPGDDPSRRLWPYRDALRADLREALNPLRAAWNAKSTAEKYALPEVHDFCCVLDVIFDQLTDGVKEQFGIRRGKKAGIRVERMPAALTCYLAVFTREGTLRVRPDGEFIGIRFILDAIGLSSSYRPNMARSQLTHHGMRHYKGGRDGGCRGLYMRNLRHFLAALRDYGKGRDPLTADSVPDTLTGHSEHGLYFLTCASDPLTSDSVPDTLTLHSEPGALLERRISP